MLLKKLNYRNVILDQNTEHETVQVRLNSGELREIIWLGQIERSEIADRLIKGNVRPVKINVHSYRPSALAEWVALRPGEFVQGCLEVGAGVCAVVEDGKPRIICQRVTR